MEHLEPGDTIIDGGNTNFHDDQRRHGELAEKGIHYVDAGTSGGIWGLQVGYCLMVGGEDAAVTPLEPIFTSLAPEGRLPPRRRPGRRPLREDGPQRDRVRPDAGLRRGLRDHARLVVRARPRARSPSCGCRARSSGRGCSSSPAARSRRTARTSTHLKGCVADSGEGRWTVQEAIDHDVPAPVITLVAPDPLPLPPGRLVRREGPRRAAQRVRRARGARRSEARLRR